METQLTKEELITLIQVLQKTPTQDLNTAQILINLNNKIAKIVQEYNSSVPEKELDK